MIVQKNMIKNDEYLKFESDFEKYKKIIIIDTDKKIIVKNYREFLTAFSLYSNNNIDELEEVFISFIKCIAIINEIEIKIFDELGSEKRKGNTEKIKYMYMDNLESIIDIINELGVAKVLLCINKN